MLCPEAPNPDLAGSVAFGGTPVIQTPKLGARIMRYELADTVSSELFVKGRTKLSAKFVT
jgi:hypothetical protein